MTAGPTVVAVDAGPLGALLAPYLEPLVHRGEVTVLGGTDDPAAAEVLVAMPGDHAALRRGLGPGTRWVHLLAAGVDGFPFELLGDRALTCARGATAPAIAEFVLGCMLAFEKDLPGQWIDAPPAHWGIAGLGTLAGRTVGLVGLGAIGTEVARRALAFDMAVTALRRTDRRPEPEAVALVPSLEALVGAADHVVVAAPSTPGTRHLLGPAAFAAMRRGVHLVNVSRGSLIDQEALRGALSDGTVAMASLDVADPEPLPAGHWLYAHPRVRLSAHVSWSAPATLARTASTLVTNVARYRAGRPLLGAVDPVAGY